jgi:DNA repair protein RadA/Sms
VSQLDRRLNEAHKLGFRRAILPASSHRAPSSRIAGLELHRASTAAEAIEYALGSG